MNIVDPLLNRLNVMDRPKAPDDYLDGIIRRLWWRKNDTREIAEFLKIPESFAANRLARICDEVRGK